MGSQQVLRAARVVAVVAAALLAPAFARAEPALGDRVAIIDLGPSDEEVRRQLGAALVAAGLDPLIGDGVEDALAAVARDRDSILLAAAMADAQSRFGALACKEAIASARTAIEVAAARQAAGLAVPELTRAWTYVLLCADRTGDAQQAHVAATHLRTLGGVSDADQKVIERYPEVDALSNREVLELAIDADVAGADVFVDFKPVGKSPLKLVVSAGAHTIAAGAGSRRGVLTGTVVRAQPSVKIPMSDQAGRWAPIAATIASWNGHMPSRDALSSVMNDVGARVALVRHGAVLEAWGHAGRAEPLRRLGDGDDGKRPVADAPALAQLIAARLASWNERAPDPDEPLLVETKEERAERYGKRTGDKEEPTKWWVYATIGGALLAGAIVIFSNESVDRTQRIEVHYP